MTSVVQKLQYRLRGWKKGPPWPQRPARPGRAPVRTAWEDRDGEKEREQRKEVYGDTDTTRDSRSTRAPVSLPLSGDIGVHHADIPDPGPDRIHLGTQRLFFQSWSSS